MGDTVIPGAGDADVMRGGGRGELRQAAALGAEPLVIGFDVAVLDASGQIQAVHGFLDKVPAAA